MILKTYCGTREISCDNGQEAKLFYYLLREKCETYNSYGAEVIMKRGDLWESASVRNVTTSPARMEYMVEELCRNTVTPCTLQEIILEEMNKY